MKAKKLFSRIGFNYLIYGLLAIVFQIIVINIYILINHNMISDINLLSILSAICNYILPFPLFYYLMKKLKATKIEETRLGLKNFLTYFCITITLMWIGNIIGLAITTIIGGVIQSDISNPVRELINNTDILLNLGLISIIGPIFEELIFRKILIDRTIKYGASVSIILSATLFGLFHGNLNQLIYASLLGGLFAHVYIKTGKIRYSILLHILVNLMGSVVSLIFSNALMNLKTAITLPDLAIVLVYLAIFIICLFVGLIKLINYKDAKFNGEKTEINLENKYRTMFLNPGMVCFVGFYIIQIILQVLQ